MSAHQPMVVITGANGGIGSAAARSIARNGYGVVLVGRRGAAVEAVAQNLANEGHEALPVACDVSRREDVEALAGRLQEMDRPVRALINNAGVIEPIAPIETADPQAWSRALAINLGGAFSCLQALLPLLLAQAPGVVVNISSGAAHNPLEGWSAYCASKAGLAMLTRSAHLELHERGLHVYGFQPGVVDTAMQARIRASGINRISRLPRETLLPAGEPAAIVAWLVHDAPRDLAGAESRVEDARVRRRAGLGAS